MAKQLESQFSSPVLLIKITEPLHVRKLQEKLKERLIDEALERFWTKDKLTYHKRKWRKLLSNHLQSELNYGSTKVNALIRERGLLDRVTAMREKPLKPSPSRRKTKRRKQSN